MSNIAIGNDEKEHFADDLQDGYTGDYFCPNPACHVQLKLKNTGSDEKVCGSRRPYFSAGKAAPHIEGCSFSNTCPSFEGLQKAGFRADEFFRGMQIRYAHADAAEQPPKLEPCREKNYAVTTLSKLYHYCLQHRDDDALPDGTKIFDIYQDERNKNISTRERRKFRMIKLRLLNYNIKDIDPEKYRYKLWCVYPHTELMNQAAYYTLSFRQDSIPLSLYMNEVLLHHRRRREDIFLLVAGEWVGTHCYVASKRQIHIFQTCPNSGDFAPCGKASLPVGEQYEN